jgi:hypothetical protein
MSNGLSKMHLVNARCIAGRPFVDLSKQVIVSANKELERHGLWLKRHHELYSESLKECQRQLERRNVIDTCARVILLPINLLVSACAALLNRAWALTRHFRLRAELQSRINAMDQFSVRRLPEAPRRNARPLASGPTQTRLPQFSKRDGKLKAHARSMTAT